MEKYEPLNKFFKNTRRHRRFAVEMMDIRTLAKTAADTSAVTEVYKVKMLSLGGVLMEGEGLHEQESMLLMEMTLPDNVRLFLTGRVTNCLSVKGGAGTHYEIGMEFTSMSEGDRAKLKKFIYWLYLKDAGFTDETFLGLKK